MTTTNNNSITFAFRNKFEKLVTDENRPAITAAFEKFCSLGPETTDARDILWSLTYNPEIASATLEKLGLNLEIISSEQISKLRDELRHQYEKLHGSYLTATVSAEYAEAFEELTKKVGPIVADVVNEYCSYRMYAGGVKRTLFLLSDDKENYFFGGICDLGFSSQEAEYLKPFHMQIHDLLKAMYDSQQNVQSFSNTPFSGLDAQLKDAGIDLPFDIEDQESEKSSETPVEQPVQPSSEFKPLTSEAILEYKDVFTSFVKTGDLNILLEIGKLGFDLNKVMDKKVEIGNFIDANTDYMEALGNLLKAKAANDTASAKMTEAVKALNS